MPRKNESYEDLVCKLEKIINEMEGEELTLERSMKNYEEGIKLCNKLYSIINEAEGKMKILNNNKLEEFEE